MNCLLFTLALGQILALPYDFFEDSGQSQALSGNHLYEMNDNSNKDLDWGRTLEIIHCNSSQTFLSPGHM